MASDNGIVEITGPLEFIEGRWLLRIPLSAGGAQLAPLTRGIGKVVADILEVELSAGLVSKLGLHDGQELTVSNRDGKFTFNWQWSDCTN